MNRTNVVCGLFGAAFGFLFCAAGFNQYDVIHRMLLIQNADPYLVMASSVATSFGLLWVLERRGWHTPLGGAMKLNRWAPERKHLYGGVVFGTGWAITAACPGTLTGMLGVGSLLGFVLLAGAVSGILLRDKIVESQTGTEPAPSGVRALAQRVLPSRNAP